MARRKPENRVIQVILLAFDKHLGEKYEVVKVKPIFARNVLIPQGKAVLANPDTLHNYQQKIEKAQTDKANKIQSMQDLFARIANDGGLTVLAKANEKGLLYEKIDAVFIAKHIENTYTTAFDAHIIKMKKKIINTGEFIVMCAYANVDREVRLVVKQDKNTVSEDKAE